jgi:hypothetical protein
MQHWLPTVEAQILLVAELKAQAQLAGLLEVVVLVTVLAKPGTQALFASYGQVLIENSHLRTSIQPVLKLFDWYYITKYLSGGHNHEAT